MIRMRKINFIFLFLFSFTILSAQHAVHIGRGIWTIRQANEWYSKQGVLVGSNFTPAYAVNQLEFWQVETFDTARINKELSWAESIGMNTMRVFLHDLLYEQDAAGFFKRIEIFLQIAKRHHIK